MDSMNEIIQVVLFFGLLIAPTPPLGRFMARVFQGEKTFLHPFLGPVERLTYKLTRVAPEEEMSWKGYFSGRIALQRRWAALDLPGFTNDAIVAAIEPAEAPQCPMGFGAQHRH